MALLQLALGIGILAAIFASLRRSGQLQVLAEVVRGAGAHWPLLVTGALTFAICLGICACRWHLVLRSQGFDVPLHRTAELYLVGQFFNAFMLGTTGGDIVKAYCIAADSPERRTEIVSTVFIERLIGLLAIVMLAPAVMLLRLHDFLAEPASRAVFVFACIVLLGAVVGMVIAFGRNPFERLPWLARFSERRFGSIVRRVYTAFHLVVTHPRLLATTLFLSLINHLAFCAAAFHLGLALGLPLSGMDYLVVFPVINMITAVPLTPSGLGTRDAAVLLLLQPLGVAPGQAVALSLLLYGVLQCWSLVGGVVYLFSVSGSRRRRRRVPANQPSDG
jgi:uncharacterized protein (TIRG00374 family)